MESGIFDHFHALGVIPVIEIESADLAIPLVECLCEGGLPIIELTLRTAAALESIHQIAHKVPEMLLGAGTVINLEQAQAAQEAGAQFIVSPGLDDAVVIWAQKNDLPILPGAVTPTEIMRAVNLGLNLLKFFPAEILGGVKAIKAISDPFPQVCFIPSGGVNAINLADYLHAENIPAVGGSWMAKRQMIAERKFDEITRLAKEASAIVKQIRA